MRKFVILTAPPAIDEQVIKSLKISRKRQAWSKKMARFLFENQDTILGKSPKHAEAWVTANFPKTCPRRKISVDARNDLP
jgi:hypothetical protein